MDWQDLPGSPSFLLIKIHQALNRIQLERTFMYQNLRMLSGACAIVLLVSASHTQAQSLPPGGFTESSGSAVARAALSKNQINNFVPDRGLFNFPAPYNTQGVRLTNASDCGGNDCVNYTGYSYWRNMNNHVGKESMLIFLGLDRQRGGRGPSLYELNKSSGELVDLGALFPATHRLSWASGEGWYFSATMPTALYLSDGPQLLRFDVITEEMQTVFDVTDHLGAGYHVSQLHSSDNDRIHSATVRDNSRFQVQGCIAYDEGADKYHFFPIKQAFDECQIDRSGEYLIIKANVDGRNGEDNVIVTLRTGQQRLLLDENGAAGHSDVGHGYMVAADNWAKDANSWKIWDLTQNQLVGKTVYHNNDWSIFAPAHLSHTNARAGLPGQHQYACGSSVNRKAGIHANEIVCFNLDGSGVSVAVAPTMTNLDAPGGGNEYARLAKGNLDVAGKYFLWTSNLDGNRLDVFVVRVPDHLLTGSREVDIETDDYTFQDSQQNPAQPPISNNPPAVRPPSPDPVPVSDGGVTLDRSLWRHTGNLKMSGNTVVKFAGCDGCADASMVSTQYVTPEFAQLEFTVRSNGQLIVAGFARSQSNPNGAAAEFAIRVQKGIAEVRESGLYQADIVYRPGDRLGILIRNGHVEYTRNGTVFYISHGKATQNLFSVLTYFDRDAAADNVVLSATGFGVPSADESAIPTTNPVSNNPVQAIVWEQVKNATAANGLLTKAAGCHGCPDSGAVSAQVAAGTMALMNFTVESTGPLLFAGFSRSQVIPDSSSLEFGLRLQDGIAEVREHGDYRADTRFRPGDRFSIEIRQGKVAYLRNGTLFYTSAVQPAHPLYSGVSFYEMGAALSDVGFSAD